LVLDHRRIAIGVHTDWNHTRNQRNHVITIMRRRKFIRLLKHSGELVHVGRLVEGSIE
jgi:hypothetical protein